MKAPDELWTVARRFGELSDHVVFVGGMIRELFVTDPAAGPGRPTKDVDCVINVRSVIEYHDFSAQLRERGFTECTDAGAPLCRWVVEGVPVDVMPIDPVVLGFSNVWYQSGVAHAVRIDGPSGTYRFLDAVHFCATKIESFLSRSDGDFFHHDMEDLVAVVDAREELLGELRVAPPEVRQFIGECFAVWVLDERFTDALAGHLPGDAASQGRKPMLLERIRGIASLARALPLEVSGAPRVGSVSAGGGVPRVRGVSGVRGVSAFAPPPRQVEQTGVLSSRVTLRSSNLDAVSYDQTSRTLTVEFHGGRVYDFYAVPPTVFTGLIAAASHGRYFNQWIRGRYVSRQQ